MSYLSDASLVMIPSGYKDGTLYSVKPTNGNGDFTFSRGSNLAATRVNSEGLIEKGRENLLLQSNTFDTTWSTVNASVTSGQSGYDGSSDAWLLSKTGDYGRVEQNTSASGIYTFSVYAKSGTLDWLSFENSGISADTCFFDLSNGVVGIKGSGVISTSIESIGNGWYRCSAIFNGTFGISRIQPSISDGVVNGTNGNIYIQDAQLEQGLVATDYIETTTTTEQAGILEDMPRLDYSGGSCPSLLLEPQRTNLVTQSEYYGGTEWVKTNVVVTDNDAVSPEGVQNAAKVVASSIYLDVKQDSISVSASTTYTFSFWCKLTSGTSLRGRFYNNTAGSNIEYYDYTSQLTIGEWARVERTFTTPAGCTSIQVWLIAQSGTLVTAHYWGAQLEEGSYPTSYIPTYGSSVTRGVEYFEKTGIGSLINSEEGTFFVQMAAFTSNNETTLISLSDGGPTNNIYIGFTSTTNNISSVIYAGGAFQSVFNIVSYDVTNSNKIAISYKTNEIKFFINGTLIGTDTSATMPSVGTLNRIATHFGQGSFKLQAKLNQAVIFPTALSEAECIALTTL